MKQLISLFAGFFFIPILSAIVYHLEVNGGVCKLGVAKIVLKNGSTPVSIPCRI